MRIGQRGLYVLLSLAYLAPVWSVEHVPTTDGPSHVYNAVVLRQMLSDDGQSLFHQYYTIDHRPCPIGRRTRCSRR